MIKTTDLTHILDGQPKEMALCLVFSDSFRVGQYRKFCGSSVCAFYELKINKRGTKYTAIEGVSHFVEIEIK